MHTDKAVFELFYFSFFIISFKIIILYFYIIIKNSFFFCINSACRETSIWFNRICNETYFLDYSSLGSSTDLNEHPVADKLDDNGVSLNDLILPDSTVKSIDSASDIKRQKIKIKKFSNQVTKEYHNQPLGEAQVLLQNCDLQALKYTNDSITRKGAI